MDYHVDGIMLALERSASRPLTHPETFVNAAQYLSAAGGCTDIR
jgi:hypothetical protein